MADSFGDLLADIEKHFGRGETYSREDRALITDKVVPEWVLRGRKLLPQGSPEQKRCDAAIVALRGLHAAVWPKVQFRTEP